jgi:hypothetical protein
MLNQRFHLLRMTITSLSSKFATTIIGFAVSVQIAERGAFWLMNLRISLAATLLVMRRPW